jgi:hypothetical protein
MGGVGETFHDLAKKNEGYQLPSWRVGQLLTP